MTIDEAQTARREHLQERYAHYSSYPMFLLSLVFLVGFVLVIDPETQESYKDVGQALMWVGWLAFLIDYFVGLSLAVDRRHYAKTHVVQALAVLIPPLRVLLIGRIFKTMTTGAKRKFGGRVRIYALYLTTLSMVLAAILVVLLERSDPEANITAFGDALWWTAETVSTVGYGDFYPVTLGGRIVAVALFVNGIALLSAVTATIAEKVLDYDDDAEEETDTSLADLHNRLVSIEEMLATLTAGTHSVAVSAPHGDDDDDSNNGRARPANS